jgi:type III pantothenate kinase
MTVLVVDIGNTRVKWATLRGAKLSRMRAVAHAGDPKALLALVRTAPRDVAQVFAVCVAGARMERALAQAVRRRFALPVSFVRSARRAAGVRNGYRDTWRLGADRWVGAIAAHAMAKNRAVMAVNVGTALTIDLVDARGRHRGGAIAPGPDTMVASLLRGTHGIRRRAQGGKKVVSGGARGLFANNTAQALAAGASFAAAALIDRAAAEARSGLGRAPLLLLTGGGADALRTYMKSPVRRVPDLVLRGLAVLARATL